MAKSDKKDVSAKLGLKLAQDLDKSIKNYRQMMRLMSADAPIEVLCLSPQTQAILVRLGFLRVYDIVNRDLAKVKGIGSHRLSEINARLAEFLPE